MQLPSGTSRRNYPVELSEETIRPNFPAEPSGETIRRNFPAELSRGTIQRYYSTELSGETSRQKFPAELPGRTIRRNFPAELSGGTTRRNYPAELTEELSGESSRTTSRGTVTLVAFRCSLVRFPAEPAFALIDLGAGTLSRRACLRTDRPWRGSQWHPFRDTTSDMASSAACVRRPWAPTMSGLV